MKNMKQYCNMHLTCDVLLLIDVFEKILHEYELDPPIYLSNLALIWNETRKIAVGIEIYQFDGKEIIRGISYIAQRYIKASNDSTVTCCKFARCKFTCC